MINGRMSSAYLAQVPLQIQDGNGDWPTLWAVVDTAFTGQLALPESYVRRLGLIMSDENRVTPATGQTIIVPAGNIRLLWLGRRLLVRAVQSGTRPLLGMRLLWHHHIAINAVTNGAVTITPHGGPI